MIGPRSSKDEAKDHVVFDELAVGWALHALEPEDESIFAVHLSGCARCTRTVAETSEVMAAMAADLPALEPSDGLRTRLASAVAETEQVPAPRRPQRPGAPVPAAVPPGVPAPRSRRSLRRLAPRPWWRLPSPRSSDWPAGTWCWRAPRTTSAPPSPRRAR